MAEQKVVGKIKKETYRGIHYVLKHLKYSNTSGYVPTGMGVNGEWWVVENDNTQNEIKELAQTLQSHDLMHDFLYEDSLHTWCDGMTLAQMEEAMRQRAKRDIDDLLGDEIAKKIDEKITELLGLKTEVATFKCKHLESIRKRKAQ